jgi:hypothetical protein
VGVTKRFSMAISIPQRLPQANAADEERAYGLILSLREM